MYENISYIIYIIEFLVFLYAIFFENEIQNVLIIISQQFVSW